MEPVMTPIDWIIKYLPYILPLIILQLILVIVALVDLVRRERTHGPKWMWVIIIVFINIIGPIAYLIVGRIE